VLSFLGNRFHSATGSKSWPSNVARYSRPTLATARLFVCISVLIVDRVQNSNLLLKLVVWTYFT